MTVPIIILEGALEGIVLPQNMYAVFCLQDHSDKVIVQLIVPDVSQNQTTQLFG